MTSPDGRRMIRLGLGGVALSFVGVSSVENRRLAQSMQTQYGTDWVYQWLRHRAVVTGNTALRKWAELIHNQQDSGHETPEERVA